MSRIKSIRRYQKNLNSACTDACAPLAEVSGVTYTQCLEKCAGTDLTTQTDPNINRYLYADGVYNTFYIKSDGSAVIWTKTGITDAQVREQRIKVTKDKLLSYPGTYATATDPSAPSAPQEPTPEETPVTYTEVTQPTQKAGVPTWLIIGLVGAGVYYISQN